MRSPRCGTVLAVLACALGLVGVAGAQGVQGGRVSVTLEPGRRAALKDLTGRLRAAGVPAYGVLYRSTKSSRQFEGAMLVAAVGHESAGSPPGSLNAWFEQVGRHSVGFSTGSTPGETGSCSGFVRVGDTFMSYDWVRGGSDAYGYGTCDIRTRPSTLTEATFVVTSEELAAFNAFYHARHRQLVKAEDGKPIAPTWNNPGPSNLRTEGCAGAASSALSPAWVEAFGRSLPEIRAFGQQHNIPALANAPENAATLIRAFVRRNQMHQQTDPRTLVRHHAPRASMLTVFNASLGEDPLTTLKWNREMLRERPGSGQRSIRHGLRSLWARITRRPPPPAPRPEHDRVRSWIGMGNPHTILDLAAGEKQRSFDAERMSLAAFDASLGS